MLAAREVHTLRRRLLVAGPLALLVLVVALLAGGGSPQRSAAGLPDPGALTGWAVPILRLLADLAGLASVGWCLAAGVLLPAPQDRLASAALRGVRLVSWSAAVWALAAAGELVFTFSDFLAVPVVQVLDPVALWSFTTQTDQGRAYAVQAVLAGCLAVAARSAGTVRAAVGLLLLALVGLVPPALTGHSAAAGNHDLAVASLLVHVLAAALWLGGLLALAWTAVNGASGVRAAATRYSTLALWCFSLVAVSGLANATVRLHTPRELVASHYGLLVLAKVTALAGLAVFGHRHRHRTLPALGPRSSGDRAARGREGQRPGTSGRLLPTGVAAFARLAAVELLVMVATVGLAVALSRTPTPPGPVYTDQAAAVLGFPLPAAPTLARLATGHLADGFAIAFLSLAAALYLAGLRALRRRGDRWPLGRTLCWFTGLAVVGYATVGGLGLYSHVLLSAHMVAHMLLSMVAPIFLVLAAPLTLALRTLPGPRTRGEISPRQLLVDLLHSRPVRWLTHPMVTFAIFVGSLYGLYFTGLFDTLMTSHLGHVLMAAHFLASGSLFFYVLVGVDPAPRRLPPLARLGILFAAMPFHAFFAIAVMSSTTLLGADYFSRLARPYRTDLLTDQHLAGGLTWGLGEVPIILVLAALCLQWAREDGREATRLDRRADRAARAGDDPGEDDLAAYNAYLAALHHPEPRLPTTPVLRPEHQGATPSGPDAPSSPGQARKNR
ncbi:MAG: cytochrome c oxidase assembly protein [Motilibacteraceae bacterium]